MNEKIKELEKKLEENTTIKTNIQQAMLSEWYGELSRNGIEKGVKIKVKSFNGLICGIFESLYIEYDRVRPRIMKIKKDGTAHPTATIYCYEMADINGAVLTTPNTPHGETVEQ